MAKRVDQKEQFSKRLASRIVWFWMPYFILLACVVAYTPSSGNAVIVLAIVTTIVMITTVLAYTHNSEYDKGLYTLRMLEKLKLSWSVNGKLPSDGDSDITDADIGECESEGDENG